MFDNENSDPPQGDNMSFFRYLGRPKYWFLCLSSMCVVGVCNSMNDYDGYNALLGDKEAEADEIFWLCDMIGRFFGGLLTFWLSNYVNEYVWAMIYSAFGFLGSILVFGMTMTDKIDPSNEWLVWTAVCLLGLAVGGWW